MQINAVAEHCAAKAEYISDFEIWRISEERLPMKSDFRIILHIGMYKTGTTSIQRYLTSVRDQFAAASVLYPLTGLPGQEDIAFGQHRIAVAAADAAHSATGLASLIELFDRLEDEASASRAQTVILSSEDFCSARQPHHLAKVIGSRDVQIYISLRRQDEFLNAMYYTSLMVEKHGLTPQEYQTGKIERLLDYHKLLRNWRDSFETAKFSVRIYEKGRSPRSDSIGDFLKVTGLEGLVPAPQERLTTHRTLPARVTMALKELMGRGLSVREFNEIFTACHKIYDGVNEETVVFTPSERLNILDKYRESNRRVRKEFYDGVDDDLFRDTPMLSDAQWWSNVGEPASALPRLTVDFSSYIINNKTPNSELN